MVSYASTIRALAEVRISSAKLKTLAEHVYAGCDEKDGLTSRNGSQIRSRPFRFRQRSRTHSLDPPSAGRDGGVGVSAFDAMTPLVRWVEKRVVPERIIGSRIVEGKTIPHSSALSLSAGGEIHRHQKHRRCRPLCLPPAITAPECRPMSLMTKVSAR